MSSFFRVVAMDFQNSVLGRMNGFLYRCRADENYTMLEMTDGIARVFGYPTDEIVGNRIRTFTSIMCEEDIPRMDELVALGLRRRPTGRWNIVSAIIRATISG
jgi:hypothetical protein